MTSITSQTLKLHFTVMINSWVLTFAYYLDEVLENATLKWFYSYPEKHLCFPWSVFDIHGMSLEPFWGTRIVLVLEKKGTSWSSRIESHNKDVPMTVNWVLSKDTWQLWSALFTCSILPWSDCNQFCLWRSRTQNIQKAFLRICVYSRGELTNLRLSIFRQFLWERFGFKHLLTKIQHLGKINLCIKKHLFVFF